MYASFILVGILALTAVRGFLINLSKLFHAVYAGVPPAAALLLLIKCDAACCLLCVCVCVV